MQLVRQPQIVCIALWRMIRHNDPIYEQTRQMEVMILSVAAVDSTFNRREDRDSWSHTSISLNGIIEPAHTSYQSKRWNLANLTTKFVIPLILILGNMKYINFFTWGQKEGCKIFPAGVTLWPSKHFSDTCLFHLTIYTIPALQLRERISPNSNHSGFAFFMATNGKLANAISTIYLPYTDHRSKLTR